MPVRITGTARAQYFGIIRGYLRSTPRRSARPAAVRKLLEAYDTAVEAISNDTKSWLSHPRPYPQLARLELRWIKVHRYWFGYMPGAEPIIANLLEETSDIPRRVSPDRIPIGPA